MESFLALFIFTSSACLISCLVIRCFSIMAPPFFTPLYHIAKRNTREREQSAEDSNPELACGEFNKLCCCTTCTRVLPRTPAKNKTDTGERCLFCFWHTLSKSIHTASFFQNRSVFFARWIDLPLGDDGSCTRPLSSGVLLHACKRIYVDKINISCLCNSFLIQYIFHFSL